MRYRFPALAAAAVALLIAAGGCAKEKAPSPPEPAARETSGMESKRPSPPAAGVKWFSGTILAVDRAAGTLTMKGPKGERTFRTDEDGRKDLASLKAGDKVIVRHTEGLAHSIVKPSVNYVPRPARKQEPPVSRPQ